MLIFTLATTIVNCHILMQLFDLCQIHHVHCERNAIVDVLAKDNIALPCGTAIFCSPPAHVAHLVY